MYGLTTEASFDSAHFLTNYYGKCENLHGHRWRVVVTIEQDALEAAGTGKDMVLDFGVFKKKVREAVAELDHMFLVEGGSLSPETIACLKAEGFTLKMLPFRTTAENLARYFYRRLADEGLPVAEVEVDETPNNRAFFRPDDIARPAATAANRA